MAASPQIRGEYHLGDVDLYYPGASLGIVEVDPETTDADSALHAADIAMYQEKNTNRKHLCRAFSATFLRRIHILLIGDNMRIGIIFPVVIFITAVVFLAWFLLAAMLPREHKDEKTTIIMMGVAIIVVLGTELGWW